MYFSCFLDMVSLITHDDPEPHGGELYHKQEGIALDGTITMRLVLVLGKKSQPLYLGLYLNKESRWLNLYHSSTLVGEVNTPYTTINGVFIYIKRVKQVTH